MKFENQIVKFKEYLGQSDRASHSVSIVYWVECSQEATGRVLTHRCRRRVPNNPRSVDHCWLIPANTPFLTLG